MAAVSYHREMAGDPQNSDDDQSTPAQTDTTFAATAAGRTSDVDTSHEGAAPDGRATPGSTVVQSNGAAGTAAFDDAGQTPPDEPAGAVATTSAGTPAKTIIREIVETLLLALLVFLAVRASFQNFKVDGESMMPTLHNGQFMIVNKIEFAQVDAGQLSRFIPFLNASPHEKRSVFHGPSRGDIVVLVNPQEPSIDLVKRVIGLPGETLQIVDGHVYINNHLLIEPYIKQPWGGSTPKITIPAGQYFVMGDNRTNSLDSRSPQVGLIPRDLVIGKAMLTYWPLSRFGLPGNASPGLSATQTTPQVALNGGTLAAGS